MAVADFFVAVVQAVEAADDKVGGGDLAVVDVAGDLDVHGQAAVCFDLGGSVVEQDDGAGGVVSGQKFGGGRAAFVEVVVAAGDDEAVCFDDAVGQHADAGFFQLFVDFALVAEEVVVAEGGVHAQRGVQAREVGAHVFAAVRAYVVVHQVARQQDEVGFFRFHDGGEAVELAAADEDAQMQVGGGGDAQGAGEFFIDDYALVAHDGGVGVVQPQAEQGGDKEGGEQAQGAGEAGLRQQAA